MSVSDPKKIDAIAAKDNMLIMLITDHLRWDKYQVAHLQMLQDKLNTYIRFIDNKGYAERFPDKEFTEFVIEINFLHQYDEGFVKMLELAKPELFRRHITVKYSVE